MKIFIILSNIIAISLTVILILKAPPEIPLYYARIWGEDQLGMKWEIVLLPILINIGFFVTDRFTHLVSQEDIVFIRIARGTVIALTILAIGVLMRIFFIIV